MENKEDIKSEETEERESNRVWNKQIVIFLVLPILLTVLVPLGGFPYLCGRLNYHLTLICLFYPIVFVFIVFCFFVGALRLFRDWKKVNRHRKILIFAQFFVPVLFVILYFKPSIIPFESILLSPGELYNYGLRDRIKSKADIKAIRNWLRTFDKEDYDKVSGIKLPWDECPKSLRMLKTYSVNLGVDGNGNPKVRIVGGGGLFHWCVEIGMEDMEIPLSELEGLAGCWLLVEPGVYVYNW